MSSRKGLVLILVSSLPAFGAPAGRVQEEQPWQHKYVGKAATGPEVIALWAFDAGAEKQDVSGHGHVLRLRGEARFVEAGRFGGCLESFPADSKHDKPQGAEVQNAPALSPAGAFTLEAWVKAKPEMDNYRTVFVLDKKYYHYAKDLPQANHDYCFYLLRTGENRRRMVAYLGYGTDSAQYQSADFELKPGRWVHLAFTYDGAGTGRFFLNGKCVGKTVCEGRGAISPGSYNLVLGDRYGSTHCGFPGYLDQVRICRGVVPFFSGSMAIDLRPGPTAFVRGTRNARLVVVVSNDTGKRLTQGSVRLSFAGVTRKTPLPDLRPGAGRTLVVPVDTSWRAGTYSLHVAASAVVEGKRLEAARDIDVTLTPRPLPNQMPVVMWGTGDIPRLKEIGFTHHLVHAVDYAKVWAAGRPTDAGSTGQLQQWGKMLDELLVNGLHAAVYLRPGPWVASRPDLKKKYQRIDRAGKPYDKNNICATFPEIQRFGYNTGASVARSFGKFAALDASLIHSEVRDGTNLCFHPHDRKAFRLFAGYGIPDRVVGKHGVRYTTIAGFPGNRVVPDDDPVLTFYRWFWKTGDGWNDLHTRVSDGLKSTGRKDLWTWFDPAVRVPSVWGSGGRVDVISQWTYSYPDPIKVGQAADELFAMAAGAPGQQVMKMTQVIWYRNQTAPKSKDPKVKQAQWEKDLPDARFITIAPDHLREAFWEEVSRPVRGIMYHGWGSLVQASSGSYRYTNPKTKGALAELIRTVVRPLGPTFLQVADPPGDVAVLESFASQVFAGRGTWGWSGNWEADTHLILQWAHLQPKIIYDETILRDGLGGCRVLVLPDCDVLTKRVVARIAEFQNKGGLLVADENLCPALTADILLPAYKRTGKAREDKAALQQRAAALRRELDDFYQRHVDASNPDLVVRCRRFRDADYVFVLNDKRTYGDYVGQHRLVMEKGLPNEGTVSVRRPRGFAYDLVAHREVPVHGKGAFVVWETKLGPGEGRVYLVVDRPLARVRIRTPKTALLGRDAVVRVEVSDSGGRLVPAVVPVEVTITDAQGRPAEGSGYYGARDGAVTIPLALAPNDLPGRWTVRAVELASGKAAAARVVVRKP